MQYTVEDVSAVRKKVIVSVPMEEADAALSATIAMYRTSVSFAGFRKGKVPAGMVEKRLHKEIYTEATTELVNVHINQIMGEGTFVPVSRIEYDGGQLERGHDFTYSISFDVMPEFALPDFEGFPIEQQPTIIDEREVDSVVERLRNNMAEQNAVGESRTPQPGDIATIDFSAYDEEGNPVEGIKAENFQLPIGEEQSLPDFENLVSTVKPGENTEGPVTFPEDFFNPEFAGRTVTMKVTLHGLKERKLPDLDDSFAQKAGGFETLDKLRENIRSSYAKSREELHKSEAQKKLLDGLLKLCDFELPESMVENNVQILVDDTRQKLERQGKGFSAIGKTEEQVREELLPEAQERTRSQILLMAVARANSLEVTEQEVDTQIRRIAMQSGQDYDAIKDYYVQHNLLFALRDRMLADKAMDLMYSKAEVTFLPAAEAEAPSAEEEKA